VTTPFSVCPDVTVNEGLILEHVILNGCSGTPTVTIGPGNTYTVSCTSAAGCPCSASGSWTINPGCTLAAGDLTVCPGVTPTEDQIRAVVTGCDGTLTISNVDATTKSYLATCVDSNGCTCEVTGYWDEYPGCTLAAGDLTVCPGVTPTEAQIRAVVTGCDGTLTISNIDPATKSYLATCVDSIGCTCTVTGYWTEYPGCTLDAGDLTVCPGVTPTEAQIRAVVTGCDGTLTISNIDSATKSYLATCLNSNGCTCEVTGYWDEFEPCVLETTPFSVPCNTVPTDDEILAHVDLNSECADAPVITRGAGNTYTVSCTDANGCPCTGSGSWTVEPCVETACETAWAFLDDWKCFTKTGNWGSLTEITPGESLTLTGDVVAGRAKCDLNKGTVVGTATITVTADGYDLVFALNDDCHVEDLHVWVNNAKPDVKGGFSDKRWYKSESMNNLKLDLTKPIWVAVHTETCCSACNDKEACTYPAPK
jgi:hypothetical protein